MYTVKLSNMGKTTTPEAATMTGAPDQHATTPDAEAEVETAITVVVSDMKAKRDGIVRHLAKLNAMIADLEDYRSAAPSPFRPGMATATGAAAIQPVLMLSTRKPVRISTSAVILDAIRRHPEGIAFDDLVAVVEPKIESTASDKRKLVHSTLDYLTNQQRKVIRKNGLWFLNTEDR